MSSPIQASVKCPFCTSYRFSDSALLLTHLNSCVYERFFDDPTNFSCLLCNDKQPSVLTAISHAQECGKKYCAIFFKVTPPPIVQSVSDTLLEPVSVPFILPSEDPLPPDHQELRVRAEITSRFMQVHPVYCGVDITRPVVNTLTVPWDFLYNRHMKKDHKKTKEGMNDIQQKKQELNDLHSFIRGKTYSREKHIH